MQMSDGKKSLLEWQLVVATTANHHSGSGLNLSSGGELKDHTWRPTVHGDHYVTGISQGLGVTGILSK